MNAIATSFNTTVSRADSIYFNSPFIPSIGTESKVTGSAFNPKLKGAVSEPIAGNSGVYVIKGESISLLPVGEADYKLRRAQMEQTLKNNLSYKLTESLRKGAKVVDNRIDFY